MDKNTLSNYGWIVIAVLVLSVMIALATPFGEYIKAGVENTTEGLFKVEQQALNVVHNPLKEKNIAVFGTSISAGIKTSSIPYCRIIAENNEMTLQNYAVGGHKIMDTLDVYRTQKSNLNSLGKDDYVIFEGLLNNVNQTLGTITPENTKSFDETTVLGALESLLYEYRNSGCKAKVGFILTHFSTSTQTDATLLAKYNKYWDDAIMVLEKYDIPYLDLRSETFSMLDKVHPDNEGYAKMAVPVEYWLKTI